MQIIIASKGEQIFIDDVDADLMHHKWYVNTKGYVRRSVGKRLCRKAVYMARLILERKLGRTLLPGMTEQADHIDLNKMNNQRHNLRLATNSQNNRNKKKLANRTYTSKYVGVFWDKHRDKWFSYIKVHGKQMPIGYFTDEKEAARARDVVALKYHGKFARLNNV